MDVFLEDILLEDVLLVDAFLFENLTIVLAIFWPRIIANIFIVSIFSSIGKWNHCFKNFVALNYSIVSITFFKWKIEPLFYQFYSFALQTVEPFFNLYFNGKI